MNTVELFIFFVMTLVLIVCTAIFVGGILP